MATSIRLSSVALLVLALATVGLAPPAAAAGPTNPVAWASQVLDSREDGRSHPARPCRRRAWSGIPPRARGLVAAPRRGPPDRAGRRPLDHECQPRVWRHHRQRPEFSATVSDPDGVKSVAFRVQKSGATAQTFNAVHQGSNVWAANLQGFTDGSWTWTITAKDRIKRGNSTTAGPFAFTVDTGSWWRWRWRWNGSPVVVANEEWTAGRGRADRDRPACTSRCPPTASRPAGPATCAPARSPTTGQPPTAARSSSPRRTACTTTPTRRSPAT